MRMAPLGVACGSDGARPGGGVALPGGPAGAEASAPGDQDMRSTIEIAERPELVVAYVEHVGPYEEIGAAVEEIVGWAAARGWPGGPDALVLGLYLDDPETTERSMLRSRACVTVPPGTPVGDDRRVGTMTIPGGMFAVGHFEIDPDEYGRAWGAVADYVRGSGHAADDRMCYEVYLNNPAEHPEGKHLVDICEPVRAI